MIYNNKTLISLIINNFKKLFSNNLHRYFTVFKKYIPNVVSIWIFRNYKLIKTIFK